MARELARRGSAGRRVDPLPATYWTLLQGVRWPGRPDRRIDEVLVGPSGVHVVLHRPVTSAAADRGEGHDLEEAADRAAAAAGAVADLVPERYRPAVTPAVCLTDTTEVGFGVGGVFAASPDVLRHSWRHQPRVLSTSEADALAERLRARLEPFPVEPSRSSAGAWWRWRRLWLAGVLTATGAVAALAAGAAQPWAQP
jgi:hypothetical protein